MSGHILIVEPIPTQRIMLRALLERRRYRVEHCGDVRAAHQMIAAGLRPDLIILRAQSEEPAQAGSFARQVDGLKYQQAEAGLSWGPARPTPMQGTVPIIVAIEDVKIATSPPGRAAARLRALAAGADDVFSRPLSDSVFLARIRNLLRARAEMADLRPRSALDLVDGFAEKIETFVKPQRIVVLTPCAAPNAVVLSAGPADLTQGLSPAISGLVARDPARFEIFPISADFGSSSANDTGPADDRDDFDGDGPAPDLIIIDAAVNAPGGMIPGDIFRLLADLRSRTPLRLAAQLLILPPETPDLAAMALDMSVDDLVTEDIHRNELSHRIETLLRQKKVADGLRASVRQGLEAAVFDPLTGLHNRRFALPHLAMLAREAAQSQRPFAVMMLDIDHFKAINDTFGHTTGDVVLCSVACRLRAELRPRDLLARIGGEEFLVVLPDTPEAEARNVAERLRQSVARRPIDGNPPDCALPKQSRSQIGVTLSVGVALGGSVHLPAGGATELIDRADNALYAAKEAGRNTVTLSASAA